MAGKLKDFFAYSNPRFWVLIAAYFVFNIAVAPLENWLSIWGGVRSSDAARAALPFTQGSFFFLAIVINSDSIFRICQSNLLRSDSDVLLTSALMAHIILLIATFGDYTEMEIAVAKGGASVTLPWGDQVVFCIAALFAGYIVHHAITRKEFSGGRVPI